MHRLGFEEKDMEQVVEILNDPNRRHRPFGLFSFRRKRRKRFDDYSHRQIETFSRCADYLQQHPSIKYCDTY